MKKYYLLTILLLAGIWYHLTRIPRRLTMRPPADIGRGETCWYTGANCYICGGERATNGKAEWCVVCGTRIK